MKVIQNLKDVCKYLAFNLLTSIRGNRDNEVKLPVLRGENRGLKFNFDLVRRKESSYLFGNYDKSILEKLKNIDMTGWVVWEFGTYLGYYTAFFAKRVGKSGIVHAFEPDIGNLRRTDENLKLNGFDNYVLHNMAVGSPLGKAEFIISGNTNSHLKNTYVGGSTSEYTDNVEKIDEVVEIEVVSVDQLLGDGSIDAPDFIKVDIEGAEKEALRYTEKLKNEYRPLILLELHNPECDASAWEFSLNNNYLLYSMNMNRLFDKKDDVYGTLLCIPEEKKNILQYFPASD